MPAIVILGLMALVVGLPFVFRKPQIPSGADRAGALKLVVLTPHNAQIRDEFSRAYNLDRANRGLPTVVFDWRVGGTSALAKSVTAQFKGLVKAGRQEEGIGVDLFWGGGEYDHDYVLARGVEAEIDGQSIRVPISVPFDVDQAWLKDAYPVADLGGAPLYDDEQRWLGAALSSFGVVFNRNGLQRHGLAEPISWEGLTSPSLMEDVALADPNHSGSITAAYEAVLKRKGWTAGWRVLRRAFANTRYFAINSARVPMDVAAGEATMGMCIDFYGRYQVGAMPNDGPEGQPRLGYIDPVKQTAAGWVSMTATNADPISLMRGAPSIALANDFAKWLLTPDAQHLWQRGLAHDQGPERYELRRQPIRRAVYLDKHGWTDPQIDPFATAAPIPEGTPGYFLILRGVTRAMAIDNRDGLKAAWQAINAAPGTVENNPVKAEMVRAFDAMPVELTMRVPDGASPLDPQVLKAFGEQLKSAYPRDQRDAKELAWARFFKRQYQKVLELSQADRAVPTSTVSSRASSAKTSSKD